MTCIQEALNTNLIRLDVHDQIAIGWAKLVNTLLRLLVQHLTSLSSSTILIVLHQHLFQEVKALLLLLLLLDLLSRFWSYCVCGLDKTSWRGDVGPCLREEWTLLHGVQRFMGWLIQEAFDISEIAILLIGTLRPHIWRFRQFYDLSVSTFSWNHFSLLIMWGVVKTVQGC